MLHAVFIRAPRITRCGDEVQVLATHEGEPVVVQQGRIMAAAFHPEIAGRPRACTNCGCESLEPA
jgi:5'-phosphate synthase pdxT subunit